MRKRLLSLFLTATLAAALTGCGGAEREADTTDTTGWTVRQMAEAILASQDAPPEMTELLPGEDLYRTYLSVSYGLTESDVADGVILAAGGTSAQEIAVFRLTEAADGQAAETLETYLENRAGSFTGYLPEEAALLENAAVASRGEYVALLACQDVTAAEEAFERCFTDPPPEDSEEAAALSPEEVPAGEPETSAAEQAVPAEEAETPAAAAEQPEADPAAEEPPAAAVPPTPEAPQDDPWRYDEARLLSAWSAGDWSGLAAEDQAILDACAEVIAGVVPADGSAYDQELAVHDWMVAHGRYDSNTLSQLPDFQENPNNDNPYGFLVDGVGICLGYTRTFQLFMDLLGIECITVEGTAHSGTADHAWNQVRLDGEWYCVDVTWDDPTTYGTVSEQTAHRYFNVTSAHMRNTDHQWDEVSVPEALGTVYAWGR